MLPIRKLAEVDRVTDPAMRDLLRKRFAELQQAFGEYEASDYGWFMILEPGDDPDDRDRLGVSFSLLRSPGDGVPYGEEGFVPPFEWVADYGFCFEAVTVIADAGDFVSVIVPKERWVDGRLTALCHDLSSRIG